MASRTKGFFEQNQSSKQRPNQWSRQPKPALQEASTNFSQPKPPIVATAKAKSKLKAYQFAPHEPTTAVPGGDDKENAGAISSIQHYEDAITHPCRATPKADRRVGTSSNKAADIAPNTPSLLHANTFPSTPSGRLSLEDLIGNGEEPLKAVRAVHEPLEEQISWNPHNSENTPNRKRKRARSSSPSCPTTSSQSLEKHAFPHDSAAQRGKATPEADPIAALWQAYGGRQTESSLGLPDLSHLIVQASPRSIETPVKSAGLRRWASTGNDWPSTTNKRRRINATTGISPWQGQASAIEPSVKSRVASMVQQVQESLATQRLEQAQMKPVLVSPDGPSSSSPLPDTTRGSTSDLPGAESPLDSLRHHVATLTRGATVLRDISAVPQLRPFSLYASNDEAVSGAGPPARAEAAQDSIISAPLHLHSKAPLPAYKRPAITRAPIQPKVILQPQHLAPPTADFDDFDDSFDLTADDLDELMSGAPPASQLLHNGPAQPNPPQRERLLSRLDKIAEPSDVEKTDHDDDDEFGCDDIDEVTLAEAEFSATQALRVSPRKQSTLSKERSSSFFTQRSSSIASSAVHISAASAQSIRYVVKQVISSEYTTERGSRATEKVLTGEDESSSSTIAITLRGSWNETAISEGDVIHIAYFARSASVPDEQSTPRGQIVVSDDEYSPILVVHPDHMLSATTVADSFDCIRKAVLQDRIKATGDTNKAMVYGKILHEIFQQALSANQWNAKFLLQLVSSTIQSHIDGLWALGMRDVNLATEEIQAKMSELTGWANIFVKPEPSEVSLIDDQQGESFPLSISKLIAIEEHIWSPYYGLKGNVDATVETTVIRHPAQPSKTLIAPFEVKTGRTSNSAAHRAQTALYTLLLSDRYRVNVAAGILYYLESSSMTHVTPPLGELKQMIQQRNRLASHIHSAKHPSAYRGQDLCSAKSQDTESSGLPSLLKNPFKCGKCYANQSCFTYHALVENGSAETAGMVDDSRKDHSRVWKEATGHLMLAGKDQTHSQTLKGWFTKWDRLLTFEEGEGTRLKRELWTMSSMQREQLGRCFGELVLLRDLTSVNESVSATIVDGIEGSGKINRFAYAFARQHPAVGRNFTEGSQLTIGEPIVVSSEQGQWALANGYVIAVTNLEIAVTVDRKLGTARQRLPGFENSNNQSFKGIMATDRGNSSSPSLTDKNILYRIDKDEFSNGLALVRNNLVTLMSPHPIHSKLRNQVILGTNPTFAVQRPPIESASSQLGEMNNDQREAVSKVMSAKDYALILGMPGTGKTTTIAHIIQALLISGQSILLTSFTHSAVDNILMKIRDLVPSGSILRLGNAAKVSSQVKEFCKLATATFKTIDEIDDAYMRTQIVATTCMGTNHVLFSRRSFDVCIVDEASQITLPTILGPLLYAHKFVLVGDHYQLPPLVQSKAALNGGLDVSLFKQLSEEHPEAVAKLGLQYRMCADIMSLSNDLVYDGQLRCGNEVVASRTLHLPNSQGLHAYHKTAASCRAVSQCWLARATSPTQGAVFANIDSVGESALETITSGKNITNCVEAALTAQLVQALIVLGVPASDIGVITLYRSQLALLRQTFKSAGIAASVEIDSADRFQGRDKECIVLSMVRSNAAGIVGDLLKDWRRVNVALTRARSKLIILGSRRTLQHNALLQCLLDLLAVRRCVLDVPRDALTLHDSGFTSQDLEDLRTASSSQEDVGTAKTGIATGSMRNLAESASAGNRMPRQTASAQPRRIDGKASIGGSKVRKAKEQIAFEIFEDLEASSFDEI